MSDFTVHVDVEDGLGRLRWDAQLVDAETLQRAVSLAADDAILAHDVRRITVELPETDTAARVAVQRAGFRLEGRLRQAYEPITGDYIDVMVYARLATDPVYGPHGFSGMMDAALPKKRLIGHALFRDADGRVLLLETSYKTDWELPGGIVEPGESPRAGAEREIREELGMEVSLGQPLLVDWMPPYLGWSDALELIFDGGIVGPEQLQIDGKEILAAHFVAASDLDDHVTELSARRIRALLDGHTGYTENGMLDR
ncbi:NUDIX domain-containing protein [Tessaracoccus caeni]|uniref:NUDIX domain-containing protein n=1 Tax=Tessaracoccus caeni TaxID=3031239 RepID=UPI0023DB69C9|nr:NUDIX domain-containing protein [Tessaracoccus caeni]MDF1489464.1 NUDIX domain-containing protein [Tessaracoccus caeni]